MVSGAGRTRVRRWFVTAAALAVVSAALPAAPAHAAGGTIAGRVTGSGGVPLDGVCVKVSAPQPYSRPVASATSAGDGTYAVTAPAGSYVVSFVDCGGRDLVTSFWRGVRTRWAATPVTVSDGQRIDGIDGTLGAGGAMSGVVTTTAGTPVHDAQVSLRFSTANNTTLPEDEDIRTDAEGRWVAHGLPPGAYEVAFGTQNQTWANVLYGDTPDAEQSPQVDVVAGQTTTGIDARIPVAGSISGVVRDDDGQPHERVCVSAVPSLAAGNLQVNAVTAADGAYTIERLTPGTYRVQLSDCGGVTAVRWYPGVLAYGDATPVVVGEAAAVTGIDGVYGRGIHVAGTVRGVDGEPVSGVGVAVYDGITGSYTGRGAFTDAAGRYKIVGLRGTVYKLKFYGSRHNDLVERWWPGVPLQVAAAPVSLVAGVSLDDVDMMLPKGGRITGTVTAPGGGPAYGVCVYATNPLTGQGDGVSTGADGTFVLRALDEGTYRVFYRGCRTENYAPRYYGGTDDPATADPVVVALGEETAGIDAALSAGGTITGTVTDVLGRPLSQVCVNPVRYGPGIGNGGSSTDENGRYTIIGLAPHADYRVQFTDCFVRPGRYVEVWNDGAEGYGDAPTMDVRAGEPVVADATMVRGGSFSGTVYDQFGLPLSGVCMHAIDGDGSYRGTWHTDQSGTYSLGGLRPGTYGALFTDCGAGLVTHEHYEGTFEVRAGEDTPGIDVTLTVITTPKAPLGVTGTPGDGSATVAWKPPTDTGHSPVTAYEVRTSGGVVVATTSAAARSAKVPGLTNGTTYAFTVNAVNVKGSGDDSPAVSVRPRPPARLSVAAPAAVVSGSPASLTGRLTDKGGAAVPGARVDLLGRRRGSTAAMTRLTYAATSPTGAFRLAIRPTYPMEYALRYAGTSTIGPVSVPKVVPVSPRLAVSVSGRAVSVSVSPAGGGGRARLQVLRSTGWVSVVGADLPSTGRVTLRAPTGGLYRVVVVRSGWATATGNRLRLA